MAEDRKKLLFVITQGVVGGAQKYVFDLAKHFNSNYDVLVAIGGKAGSGLFGRLESQSIRTHCLKFLGRDIKIGDDILAFFEMLKLFKEEKPNIVHLNSSKIGLIGALAGYFSGVRPKIIFTAHGWIFKEDLPRLTRFAMIFLSRFAALFQDQIICVSKDDFNQALQNKVAPARKLYTIYNAVSGEKFLTREKARSEISRMISRELSKDDFVITNFGRLYTNKGLGYLISAVKEIKQNIILVIFGDGPEREALKQQVTSNKLQDSIFLVGDKPVVSQYLKAFDAMVLSSVKEGFPYALLEAGVAGVPVIATNVGGIGEIIKDSETGVLVESKNVKALTDSILKIYNDKELGQKISANLKKIIAKDFSFENLIEKTEWVYKV